MNRDLFQRPDPRDVPSLRVLIVDDELNIRRTLLACVRGDGHDALTASSSAECFAAIHDYVFDLCILDLRLGVESGLDLIGPLREAQPWLRIIVMTGFPGIESAVAAVKLGATNYVSKPLTPAQIRLACKETISMRSLMEPAVVLPGTAVRDTPAVGFETTCPQMRAALESARVAARSGAVILIQGEPGTGKRTLANAIHAWSDRADKPLVYAGCRGPSALHVGYDWFGSIRETRNRAPEKRPGRVSAAGAGTLVFEEICELDETLHPRLLQLIQQREFIPTGETTSQQSDARFIVTNSTSLQEAIQAGTFPAILGDALSVVTINLPPLRRRHKDILMLAQAYARYFSRTLSKPLITFDESVVNAMLKHSWPGNVRELKNFVERAIMLSTKGRIDLREIPMQPLNNYASVSIGDRVTLKRVEEMHIRAVIYASRSIDDAAQTLGMDTVTLWRRRKRYGIGD